MIENQPLLSIIVPAYNEASNIASTINNIGQQLKSQQLQFEIIIIDDGSIDDTWSELQKLEISHPELRAFRLSRNFGKEAALRTGLHEAKGDAMIFIDADLQHPPSLLPDIITKWRDHDCDIVEAVKRSRGKETLFHRLCSEVFYGLIKKLSGLELKGSSDYKLINRKIAQTLKEMPEVDFFFRGMCVWVGFKRGCIEFDVPKGNRAESRWSFYKKAKLFFSGIVSLSSLPLHFVTLSGIFFFFFAILLGIQTLYMKFSGNSVSGFTTVILLILITGSILMIALGVIGLYISTIYEEVKKRPVYLISSSIRK